MCKVVDFIVFSHGVAAVQNADLDGRPVLFHSGIDLSAKWAYRHHAHYCVHEHDLYAYRVDPKRPTTTYMQRHSCCVGHKSIFYIKANLH